MKTIPATSLEPNTDYRLYVRAVNDDGNSAWSLPLKFTTVGAVWSDGNAPEESPEPTTVGGLTQIFVKWQAIGNPDLVEYEVHVIDSNSTDSLTPPSAPPVAGDPETLAVTTASTMASVGSMPDETKFRFQPDGIENIIENEALRRVYWFSVIAKDQDGPATTASAWVPGSMDRMAMGDLVAGSVTSEIVEATFAMFGSLGIGGDLISIEPPGLDENDTPTGGFIIRNPANLSEYLVQLHPYGSFFRGRVETDILAVLRNFTMQETGELDSGATMILRNGVADPTVAATLSKDYPVASFPAVPSGYTNRGITYGKDAGGIGVDRIYRLLERTIDGRPFLQTINPTTMSVVGSIVTLPISMVSGFLRRSSSIEYYSGKLYYHFQYTKTGAGIPPLGHLYGVIVAVSVGSPTTVASWDEFYLSSDPSVGESNCALGRDYSSTEYPILFFGFTTYVDGDRYGDTIMRSSSSDLTSVRAVGSIWEDSGWGSSLNMLGGNIWDNEYRNVVRVSIGSEGFADNRLLVATSTAGYVYDPVDWDAYEQVLDHNPSLSWGGTDWPVNISAGGIMFDESIGMFRVTAGGTSITTYSNSYYSTYDGMLSHVHWWLLYANTDSAESGSTAVAPVSIGFRPKKRSFVKYALPPQPSGTDGADIWVGYTNDPFTAPTTFYKRSDIVSENRTGVMSLYQTSGSTAYPEDNELGGSPATIVSELGNFIVRGDGTGSWPLLDQFTNPTPYGRRNCPNSTQTIANGTWTTIEYTVGRELTGGLEWNPANSTFIVHKAGLYTIHAGVLFSASTAGARRGIAIHINGVEMAAGLYPRPPASQNQTPTISTVQRLVEGDTIKAAAFQDSGNDLTLQATTSQGNSRIEVAWIGP